VPASPQAVHVGAAVRAERARRRIPAGGAVSTSRRRRGIALLGLAAACGGLAASDVERRARSADERVGQLVPVAVARTAVRAGTRLTPAVAARAFAVRQAPARFVPPDSLPSPADAAGGTVAVPL